MSVIRYLAQSLRGNSLEVQKKRPINYVGCALGCAARLIVLFLISSLLITYISIKFVYRSGGVFYDGYSGKTAFAARSSAKELTLRPGTTKLYSYGMSKSLHLQSVTLPDSLTEIGN